MDQIVFSLLLILLPTQLGLHFWPTWSLVLGRRIDYLSPTLYLTDVIIFLLLFWVVTKPKIVHISFYKILLFSVFIFLNIYFAANKSVAMFAWLKVFEMIGLGLYIIKTIPKVSAIIFPLSIGVFYSSLIAIVHFFLQHSIGGIFWFLGERTFTANTPGIAQIAYGSFFKLRSYATFSHPNVLGGYLAILLPLIILQLSNSQILKLSNSRKYYFILTIILGTIALALTFSRSAWVIFVLSILYIVFKKYKKFFLPILILVISIIFLIGKTVGFQDESVIVREQLNTSAISMIISSPIIGTGLGNFLVRLPDYLVSRTIYFLQPVHNIYLLIFSETGIVGFSVFLWLIWKSIRKNIFIVPILFLGLVDHYFLTLQQGQLLITLFLSLSLIQ